MFSTQSSNRGYNWFSSLTRRGGAGKHVFLRNEPKLPLCYFVRKQLAYNDLCSFCFHFHSGSFWPENYLASFPKRATLTVAPAIRLLEHYPNTRPSNSGDHHQLVNCRAACGVHIDRYEKAASWRVGGNHVDGLRRCV